MSHSENRSVTRLTIKRLVQIAVGMLVTAAILFASSGQLDWMWAWAYIAVNVGIVAINALMILPKNPDLVAKRAEAKDTKSWDKPLTKILTVPYVVGAPLIAGLDNRFGWSPQFDLTTHLVALVFVITGNGFITWAMVSNKFFSRCVRIQRERGHTVVTTGPYRYVRHPGYLGMITNYLATPLLLGSLWALIPAAFVVCGLIVRTSLEDTTLQEELDGYRDYSQRVQHRLIPRMW